MDVLYGNHDSMTISSVTKLNISAYGGILMKILYDGLRMSILLRIADNSVITKIFCNKDD